MSVTAVSGVPNSDLHRLLESLIVLRNDMELEGPLNPKANEFAPNYNPRYERVTQTRQPSKEGFSMNIMVRRVIFTPSEIIDEFWVSARPDESLCDILYGQEWYSNWISIETAFRVEIPLQCVVSRRPYVEVRDKVDSWKNKLFENETKLRRPVTIILRVRDRQKHHGPPLEASPNANITKDLETVLESAPM